MNPAPSLQSLIDSVVADAATDAPLDRLATASQTVAELTDVGDAVLSHFVDQARRSGHSWNEVSTALGVTKQAAHKRFSPGQPSFERFTERAKRILEHALAEAGAAGHNYVGTEHVLLALYDEPEAIAARILNELGATREKVEGDIFGRVPRQPVAHNLVVPFTPRASALASGSVEEALSLGHNYIGTEHILLALFRDSDTIAAKSLAALGVERPQVHARIVEILSGFKPA